LFDFNDDGLRLHICQNARNWLRLRCEQCHAERIGVGPRAGQKAFTLQSVPAQGEGEGCNGAAQAGGFSLHAGLDIQPGPARQGQEERRGGHRPARRATPCGEVIASFEEPGVIARILAHRDRTSGTPAPELSSLAARAPPVQSALL
jgi:hypothetical protein